MSESIESILGEITQKLENFSGIREILLANAVMLGEIPAPTFGEEKRIRFLTDRFNEEGLVDISVDQEGSGLARLPGKTGKRNILLVAHADTNFPASMDHAMSVDTDQVTGPSIANNSLGLASIAILPSLLEKLGLELDANLLLLGSVKSAGRADLGGMRYFLDNYTGSIDHAICIEGVHVGRLSYSSLGMVRAEIRTEVPEETSWHHFGRISASRILTRILNNLYAIPIPREPKTSINIGTIQAGNTFSDMTTSGRIRFEVRSEDPGHVKRIQQSIEEIVEMTALENQTQVTLDTIASRSPGGIPYAHPLVRSARSIMNGLGIEPKIAPSVGELSALIDKGIPALTLGLTDGENLNTETESIRIAPLYHGVAQLIAMICAIDKGLCDEED